MITQLTPYNNECEFINCGLRHYTHVDGHWYTKPSNFPCVLHDKNGCLFLTQEKYHELVEAGVFLEKKQLNVRDTQRGVSKISGYKTCSLKNICPRYNPKKSGETSKKRNQRSGPSTKELDLFRKLPQDRQVEWIAKFSEMQKL